MLPAARRSRFVILEHDHPFLHWDLLMQLGEVLKTWRLLNAVTPETWIPAETLPDHRLMYLDYEGPVGGDRGSVHRVASGWYQPKSEAPDLFTAPATETTFELFDCDLATTAICRGLRSAKPEWLFR